MKKLFLIRGLPGAGKSTLGKVLAPMANVAADEFFDIVHGGRFVSSEIHDAHRFCQSACQNYMKAGHESVAVHNTFTRDNEMEAYEDLAKLHGYEVHYIIVENRRGGKSVHRVPADTIEKMRDRFSIKL